MEVNWLLREVRLDDINPFDGCHMSDGNGGWNTPTEEDRLAHEKGIEWTRGLIRDGFTIRPILITPVLAAMYHYQRLDGFKRYMAYKLEGVKTVRCTVIDQYLPGGQHGLSQVIE